MLDVGCGEGALVRRLSAAGARVWGIDPLPGALERARLADSEAPSGRYLDGHAERLPLPDASFDIVIFFNSLHHVAVDAMDRALAEAARVLRASGVLYVQEPLAEGSAFEMLRHLDDETDVRGAAQQALARALEGRFAGLACHERLLVVHHHDFDALRARVLSVDPERAVAFAEHEAALHADFARLARPLEGGGYEFDQPFRINLLALRGRIRQGRI